MGMNFSQNNNLTIHMWTQIKGNLYQCAQCDMSFSQNCNLKTHIRKHAGDRPYQCAEFQNHMRIHTGTMQD